MTQPQRDVYREIAEWQELRITLGLHREFRSKASRIVIKKPRWMPERLFRALMRTIVVEERDTPAQPASRRERRRMGQRGVR